MPQAVEAIRPAAAAPLLSVNSIKVVYDDVILVLRGLSLELPKGANGTGKSTTPKAICGLLKIEYGEVTRGEILFERQLKEFYLGGAGDQRKSFKNLKSFKRRKRWL